MRSSNDKFSSLSSLSVSDGRDSWAIADVKQKMQPVAVRNFRIILVVLILCQYEAVFFRDDKCDVKYPFERESSIRELLIYKNQDDPT
jgi:hypothetical protein